jgi:hypothetical protein
MRLRIYRVDFGLTLKLGWGIFYLRLNQSYMATLAVATLARMIDGLASGREAEDVQAV